LSYLLIVHLKNRNRGIYIIIFLENYFVGNDKMGRSVYYARTTNSVGTVYRKFIIRYITYSGILHFHILTGV